MNHRSRSLLVNAITFARVPLIFLWAALAIVQEFNGSITIGILACVAMLLSGLTDLWDGQLARKWNVISSLGKMADPLMDKVFYIVAFPVLTWQAMHQGDSDVHGLSLLAFTILYMLRDTWVTFLRSVGTMFGANVAAMWLGKVRTAMSFPGAGWIYFYFCFNRHLPLDVNAWLLLGCYVVEAVLAFMTIWSFFTYTMAYLPYLRLAMDRR